MMKRIIVFLLCVVLTFTMVFASTSIAVFSADDASNVQTADIQKSAVNPVAGRKVGDVVIFGSYPKSKVTNGTLISKLNAVEKNWQTYDYCTKSDNASEGKITISNFMNFCDFTYENVKYRAVFFTVYRPTITSDSPTADKSRQDENGYEPNTVYYFKFEGIKWKVLDPSQGYLLSYDIVDSQPYNNLIINQNGSYYGNNECTYYSTDWENCTLRSWLNGHFLQTAFTKDEQNAIGLSHLENISTYPNTAYDSNMTYDKIFIPSYNDVRNTDYGFNNSIIALDSARRASGTDYARCQGLDESTRILLTTGPYWRLRTNDGSATIHNVDRLGRMFSYFEVNSTAFGIRPALKFAPETIKKTVTFDPCGGTVEETQRNVPTGDAIGTLPVAQKDSFAFEGWFTDDEGGYRIFEDTVISKDITLYAHWTVYPEILQVDKKPSKIVYDVNEPFDCSGAQMRVIYSDKTSKAVSEDEVEINGFDPSAVGYQKVYLSYTEDGFTAESFRFTLIVGREVTGLYVTQKPTKTLYIMGEPFERDGMVVIATFNDGTSEDVTNYIRTSGYESTSPGIKKMTVSYTFNDKTVTAQFSYQMNPKLRGITIERLPDKTQYVQGEQFDRTGMVVSARFSDGSTSDISDLFRTSGFTTKTTGEKVMRAYYSYGTQSFSQEFTINVIENVDRQVTELFVAQKPVKTLYYTGDEFEQNGLKITARYSDATTEDVTEDVLVTGFDSETAGTKKMTVSYTYKDKTVSVQFSYQVCPILTGVTIIKLPDKTEYVKGEPFDRTGMEVTAQYSDGSTKDVTNLFRTSGFTTKTPGEKTMSAYYTDGSVTLSDTFKITVV